MRVGNLHEPQTGTDVKLFDAEVTPPPPRLKNMDDDRGDEEDIPHDDIKSKKKLHGSSSRDEH